MRRAHRRAQRPGFTLIELLVVLAIIAALASVVGPSLFRNVGDAKTEAARAQLESFSLALNAFRLDNDRFPTSAEGLEALRRASGVGSQAPRNWRGPYLSREVPLDPWGRPYHYVAPGRETPSAYDLWTLGRDGAAGGEGEDADVTSWGGAVGSGGVAGEAARR